MRERFTLVLKGHIALATVRFPKGGPQRISKAPNNIALKPGMIVSNEPGYYKTGEYGIRIENLQYVTEPRDIKGGERPMMGFETPQRPY